LSSEEVVAVDEAPPADADEPIEEPQTGED
jgi:hypothetical protein